MNSELIIALDELEKQRGIKKSIMLEALEAALITACKRNFASNIYIKVDVDKETGQINAYTQRKVVEEVDDPNNEISIEEAKIISPKYELDDFISSQVDPARFGRIAAQTAKQIIVQRIREAERGNIYSEFSEKEGKMVTGIIQKPDRYGIIVTLDDNIEAILAPNEQVPGEKYEFNKRMKFYVLEIRKSMKGPQIMLSRTHPGLIRRLFEHEVPEIEAGIVQIKSVTREAGSRTKMSVYSENPKVDAIGTCVGQRGTRVANIVEGLGDEKIDIVKYSEDPAEYIKAAISPAKAISVEVNEEEMTSVVVVPDYQLSLAIGKEGQNVRLAARLTGWKIDIKSDSVVEKVEQ